MKNSILTALLYMGAQSHKDVQAFSRERVAEKWYSVIES